MLTIGREPWMGGNFHDSALSRKGDSVKKKALQLSISLWFGLAAGLFAQTNLCTNSNKLICLVPFSGTNLTLATFGTSGQSAAAEAAATFGAAASINAAVAAQLTQLPVPSATVGVIQIKRKGSDVPLPFTNLGPVLTDRPDTVGRGHLFAGFGYQHFNFNALDGFNLTSLPIAFTFQDPVGTASPKIHYGALSNNIGIQLDQYIFIATAGVSPTTDVSVIIPLNSVAIKIASSNFKAFDYDIKTQSYSRHSPPAFSSLTSHGSAYGLGDITMSIKQMVVGQDHNRPAAAIGANFRFPSGDSFNYLGSGALGGSVYGLVEYRARIAMHAKIGYQWNDSSKVLNLQQQGETPHLPGGLQYAVGTDIRLHRKLTLTADFLGNQFVNTPTFTKTTSQFNPAPDPNSGVPASYDIVSTPNQTYTTVNFSSGLKWNPVGHLLLYGNALMSVNNVGLRSDIVPVVGIAYNFSTTKSK